MTPHDTEIPADLADAVRHAAAAVPAGRHSMSEVHRRRRLHQRRRTAAVAGVATVAVAAGAAGVPALLRASGPPPTGPATTATGTTATGTAPATAAPAQRLLLGGAYAVVGTVGVRGPEGVAEVDAAGKLVVHPTDLLDAADYVVGLPDGRVVMLGPHDLRPGVAREDGVDVTDLEKVLAVTRLGNGSDPVYTADVRTVGEAVALVGATPTGAYLLRDRNRLVLHEFGSGDERPLAAASAVVAAAGDPDRFEVQVDGDRLLIHGVADDGSGQVRVYDLDSGTDLLGGPVTVAAPGSAIRRVRLSPDGRTVAVAVTSLGRDGAGFALATFPVAAGAQVRTQAVGTGSNPKYPGDVLGIAFTNNRIVRVAWYALPVDADRVYFVGELLKVGTLPI